MIQCWFLFFFCFFFVRFWCGFVSAGENVGRPLRLDSELLRPLRRRRRAGDSWFYSDNNDNEKTPTDSPPPLPCPLHEAIFLLRSPASKHTRVTRPFHGILCLHPVTQCSVFVLVVSLCPVCPPCLSVRPSHSSSECETFFSVAVYVHVWCRGCV